MATDDQDWTNINFDNDWVCYCQQSTDQTDETTIISTVNNIHTDLRWSPVQLPHIINTFNYDKQICKWWYSKQFHWALASHYSRQHVYLDFESMNTYDRESHVKATIWLNNTRIFSGSLMSLRDSIELSSNLLRSEEKHDNILVIRCINTNLSLHAYLAIYGKFTYAAGQVIMDEQCLERYRDLSEKSNQTFDYKVNLVKGDGRIDIVFTPKRKSKTNAISSLSLQQSSQLSIDENQTNKMQETLDDDLLVPRLAIVILIVGKQSDVQPFIA